MLFVIISSHDPLWLKLIPASISCLLPIYPNQSVYNDFRKIDRQNHYGSINIITVLRDISGI